MSSPRLALTLTLLAAPALAPARAGEPAVLAAVAGDLAGTGEPMLVVSGFRGPGGRAEVPVLAQRDGGWQVVARAAWPGDGDVVAVEIADVEGDARPEVLALGRASGRARLVVFELGVGSLVALDELDLGDGRGAHARRARRGAQGSIRWPLAGGAIELAVRDGLSGPAMARTVLAWDDELARLAAAPPPR